MFVLGPLTFRYRECNPGKVSQSTQQCFKDDGFALKMAFISVKKLPNLRKFEMSWDTMSGTVCSCFYDKCNDIAFEELSALTVAPTTKGTPTSTTATTTSDNDDGKQITAIARTTRANTGKQITTIAGTTRGNTGKHITTIAGTTRGNTGKQITTIAGTTRANTGKQITAIAGTTRPNTGKQITTMAATTRGMNGKHIATRTSDSEVSTAGKNKNDKPMIEMWLLLLYFVITLLF